MTEVLDTIAPPYSQEFVELFLPLAENEMIVGDLESRRQELLLNQQQQQQGGGMQGPMLEEDPVSEFVVHCRATMMGAD